MSPKAISNESTDADVVESELMLKLSSPQFSLFFEWLEIVFKEAINERVDADLTLFCKFSDWLSFGLGTELLLFLWIISKDTFWREISSSDAETTVSSLMRSFSKTSISIRRKTSRRSLIFNNKLLEQKIV